MLADIALALACIGTHGRVLVIQISNDAWIGPGRWPRPHRP